MKVEVITPDKTLFDGELNLVAVPGIDGSFEVMNFHAPLISILVAGKVKLVDHRGHEEYLDIRGGVIEVNDNAVKILAE